MQREYLRAGTGDVVSQSVFLAGISYKCRIRLSRRPTSSARMPLRPWLRRPTIQRSPFIWYSRSSPPV